MDRYSDRCPICGNPLYRHDVYQSGEPRGVQLDCAEHGVVYREVRPEVAAEWSGGEQEVNGGAP